MPESDGIIDIRVRVERMNLGRLFRLVRHQTAGRGHMPSRHTQNQIGASDHLCRQPLASTMVIDPDPSQRIDRLTGARTSIESGCSRRDRKDPPPMVTDVPCFELSTGDGLRHRRAAGVPSTDKQHSLHMSDATDRIPTVSCFAKGRSVEFVAFEEAWRLLKPIGVEVSSRTAEELRLSISEGDHSGCIDIAASDHAHVAKLPADMLRLTRAGLATSIEAIIHKLHLTQAHVIPVGHWRELFEAVAEPMAANAKWRAIDSAATVELNTRDALVFAPADFHSLRELALAVLTAGSMPRHGISICSRGSPMVIEVMPAGEVTIFYGKSELHRVVSNVLAHVQSGAAASKSPQGMASPPSP